jgi:cytochrome c-type biogenesis protein CcmH/NrfG/ribosomal protein L40E
MSQCVKCGKKLPTDAKFCSSCGTKVEEAAASFCRHCGTPLKPGAKFCHSCGQTADGAGLETMAETAREIENDGDGAAVELSESATPSRRSWTAILLPLIGIPMIFGILWLLLHKKENPQPMRAGAEAAQAQTGTEGVDMASMEEVRKQIDKYKSDLQSNPKDTTALLALGQMYMMASMFEQTADYFKRYLEVVPDNYQVRTTLAFVYYNNSQPQLAHNELHQALKYQPNYDYALYLLGAVYMDEGKKDEAIKSWHKVLEVSPGSEAAARAREQIMAAGGK